MNGGEGSKVACAGMICAALWAAADDINGLRLSVSHSLQNQAGSASINLGEGAMPNRRGSNEAFCNLPG